MGGNRNVEPAEAKADFVARPLGSRTAAVLVVALAYALVGKLGQLTTTLPGNISPIFPSAGIALAAVLILGRPAWLGVWLGSLLLNAIFSPNWPRPLTETLRNLPLGCLIAAGAAAGAGIGAVVVRRLCNNQSPLGSGRNVLILVALGAVICGAISPTVGVLGLSLWGLLPWKLFGYSWLTWWLGDAAGAIIAAPLVLALRPTVRLSRSPWHVAEVVLLCGLTLMLCRFVFFGNRPFEYGLIPLLLWAAFRFGMRGATIGAAVVAVFATIGTSRGTSPFVAATVNESLLLLHSFLAVTTICALVLAGVLAERKLMEAERARLATAVQQAADAIVITDTQGTIQYANPAFERLTGHVGSMVGQRPRVLQSDAHGAELTQQLWGALTRGEVWSGRIVDQRQDGTRFDADVTISPIRDAAGILRNHVVVQHDVTQDVALEAHLRQAQKMESIGQLAGGVAHDFNNLLTIIQGNASLQQMDPLSADQRAESIREILKACGQAAGLTRQLLLFSRKQAIELVNLDLNEVVRAMTKMLNRVLDGNVTLRAELAPVLPTLRGDPGMLEQVLLNLAVNARDAMIGGGRLTISTGTQIVDEAQASRNPEATAGPHVWLEVSDSGQGIAPEVLPRIFEPFFTTKEVGKGTGLGLATVHGIVKQHHGWITVDSQPGAGAVFRVWLPTAQSSHAGPAQATPADELVRGRETILLVEDEAPLRQLMSDVLRRCGYTVIEADSGMPALELWNQAGPSIDLLFTDLVMPGGITGFDLATRLRAERPDLKVLFTSGYRAKVGEGPVDMLGNRFLQKPYSPQQLTQAVQSLLEKQPA